MMMVGGRGPMRSVIGFILIVNLALYFIIIGLASWSLNQEINQEINVNPTTLFNNNSLTLLNKHQLTTIFLLIYGLLGGVIGVLSVIAGFMHHRAWSRDSLGVATATAFVSLAATAIAVGLVIKEIAIGGHRGDKQKTLEAVIIASTFFQLLYSLLLHAGMSHSRHGPAYV